MGLFNKGFDMANSFDILFPEFQKGVGIPYESLSLSVKTELAGEWLIQGQQEKVFAAISSGSISPFSPVGAFSGLSWSEYLITRNTKEANTLWLKMRKELTSFVGDSGWGDSAALAASVNNEALFPLLSENDWVETIDVFKLKDAGVVISTSVPLSSENKIEFDKSFFNDGGRTNSYDKRTHRAAIELIGFHGSKLGVECYLSNLRSYQVSHPDQNLNRGLTGATTQNGFDFYFYLSGMLKYIKNVDLLDPKPLKLMLKSRTEEFSKVDAGRSSLAGGVKSIVRGLLVNVSDEHFNDLFAATPKCAKQLFCNAFSQSWKETKVLLIEKNKAHRIEVMDQIEEKDDKKFNHSEFYLRDLWSAIDKKQLSFVAYLVNKNPEWLNEKDWVYENRSSWRKNNTTGSKKGNCLAYAAVKGADEIANFLVEKGADVKSLQEVANYEPFKNSELYQTFQPIADRIRLKQKIEVKKGVSLDGNKIQSAL